MDPNELLEIIGQALHTGATGLDLSGKGLTYLPPEIGQLTGLTSLILPENQLTVLPPEIRYLTRLTYLDLNKKSNYGVAARNWAVGRIEYALFE